MPFALTRLTALCVCLLALSTATVVAAERPSLKLNRQGVEQLQQGNYQEAINLLRKALQIQPDQPVIKANLATAYLGVGERLIAESRYAEAVEILEEGKSYADQEAQLWLLRGLALLRSNDYGYAEVELNEAWAMTGDEPRVLTLLGRLYYDTDRVRDAVDAWERVLQLDPDNTIVAVHLERARQELTVEEEMEKGFGYHFVISYDGEVPAAVSNDLLSVLEEAYDWVGYRLGHYPRRQIPVLIYAGQDFKALTNSPDWASGLYDGKIRLPAGGISQIDEAVRGLLYHEYMHVVVREMAGDRVPFWLNEGLAEVASASVRTLPADVLQRVFAEERLFAWSELEGMSLAPGESRIDLAYLQSYSMVSFLLDEFGWLQMQELLQALGRGTSLSEAIDQALGVFAVDYASLQQRWSETLVE